jgi:excisionase family DNA binding protein
MLQNSLQLLTVRETAEVLRQSEWSVRQKIGRGEFPALRVGVGPRAPFRILRADLERWLFGPPPKPSVSGATSPLAGSPQRGLEGEAA